MIKGFETPHLAEPVEKSHWQWRPAIAAGLIPAVILLVLPHATPWSGLTIFSPAVVGRMVPASLGVPAFGLIVMHFALSLVYGIIISLTVINVRELWAALVGGLVGLVLFGINFGIVTAWIPALKFNNEVSVAITHFVFGLVAAATYRGLLRRKVPVGPAA